jgi:ADP-heptose:LPS heptosyltransferase/8-oxo-dGTP pyrophosphatase MutT (NUDIX family)
VNILVIKLGALGDVIRTLPLAKAIKENFPNSDITWITKENALQLFEENPYVKKVFTDKNYPKEHFDILYNFDVDGEATKIAMETNAEKKYGFYQENGYPLAFNSPAEYYLNTMFDDNLKKLNKKTYQEMMFEVAELPLSKEIAAIYLNEEDVKFAQKFFEENKINREKIIGIHMGASSRWPSKVWDLENIKEFINRAKEKRYEILLFGGPNEIESQEKFVKELEKEGTKVYRNNPNNTLKEFASLVNLCTSIICSDSMSLHISLALKKPTICLFFCTSPNEIEDYGLLKKIISPKLYEFFPERQDEYNRELTRSISVDEVLRALEKKETKVVNAIIKHPENDKFLVIKRKEGIHENKWAFPGGIVETGESDEQALAREIIEETGLELKNIIKKISEYSYLRPDSIQTKGTCFLVEVNNSNVKVEEDEISDFKWVSVEEFENMDHIEGLEREIFDAFYNK